MSIGSLVPTAYFVTPKGKQLAKTNSTGLSVNNFSDDYQKITISVGFGTANGYNYAGFNDRGVTANYNTWFSPFAYLTYPPSWINQGWWNDGLRNNKYGAASNNNIIINNINVTIHSLFWVYTKSSGGWNFGLCTLVIALDKYVGDHINVIFNGYIFTLTIYYGGVESNGVKSFLYVNDDYITGAQSREGGALNPTGNIDFYINKNSYIERRNSEATLPAALQ